MALSAGARLGPYEILAPLGAAGRGEAYRARDPRLGRDVALKVLPSPGADQLGRLEREARAAGALNHPNILAVFDIGASDEGAYVVSELLEGATLRDRLSAGPLPLRKALDLADQIAQGLAAAHAKGIVHGDLRPENVFVTAEGRAKVLDFGLARTFAPPADDAPTGPLLDVPASSPEAAAGAVGYLSPEQARSEPAGPRSDIFAFGAVLYEMLSGSPAFKRSSAVETLNAILREDPLQPGGADRPLSPALDRIVKRCLEKRPDERFESARDVGFAVEAVSVSESRPLPALPEAGPRRTRMRAAVAAALAAFVAGLLTAHAFKGPVPESPAFRQLTFRRGRIPSARFAPDGQTFVYAAAWEGRPPELYSSRFEGPESRSLGIANAKVLSISSSGEMALMLGGWRKGKLARVSLAGGAPRELLESVEDADWTPDGALAVVRPSGGRDRLEWPVGKTVYDTTGYIDDPRVSPKGDYVAFLDHPVVGDNRGEVAVVDRAGKKTTLSAGWSGARGLAWSADGTEVWFTGTRRGMAYAVWAVTLSGRERLVLRVPGAIRLQDVDREGRALISTSQRRFAIMCLPPGERTEHDLSWFDYSWAADLSADGRTLLFEEEGAGVGPSYAVYVRTTDGAPAVRLGEGSARALSPDGRWALAVVYGPPPKLVLMPTGPGEPQTLPRRTIEKYSSGGTFLPDGRRVVFSGNEPGRGVQLYVQDVDGGAPRPFTPEGVELPWGAHSVSPDATAVAAVGPDQRVWLYSLVGGTARPVPGLAPGDAPLRWSRDGRALYVWRAGEPRLRIARVDPARGVVEPVKEIAPADPAGILGIPLLLLTPDGTAYAYGYERVLSHLYLVEGLK